MTSPARRANVHTEANESGGPGRQYALVKRYVPTGRFTEANEFGGCGRRYELFKVYIAWSETLQCYVTIPEG
jgi:hypothetical protein